jgi:hypothetical protein
MNEEDKTQSSQIDRRELVRKGAKAAYIIPAILAVVKATERPAYAGASGLPVLPFSNPAPSDQRLKKNIRVVEDAIENIEKLHGVTFDWRTPDEREIGQDLILPAGEPQIGLIAQEVEQVFPEAVATGADGVKRVNYGMLVGPLIEAVKMQQRQIDRQQRDIDDLKRAFSAVEDGHLVSAGR